MIAKVYLIGAGPGDPELITVKGRRILGLAGCILYDHLANPRLLDLAPSQAERIYVGKKRAEHAHSQEEICRIMIDRARAGLRVVRLKGGDPFIFGRGGEELEALAEAGVPYEVVPGVTSPLGIAAYTGVPLTHRNHASVVSFITGHAVEAIDWARVGAADTLVVFMGLHHIDDIARELIRHGRPPRTPALAVRWATRPDQVTVAGALEDLPRLVHEHGLTPPATILIGEVVGLREKLDWFEHLPLFGQRVVVTRARAQAASITSRLEELGAEVVHLPAIDLRPIDFTTPEPPDVYDWVIFTSTNAVEFFFARVPDLRALRGRICAIGSATQAAVEALHLRVDLTPEDASSEGVVAALASHSPRRVLLPRAAEAREVIPEALRLRGAIVDVVDVYRNVLPEDAARCALEIFSAKRRPDWITFTSGSTVRNVLKVSPPDALAGVRIVSVGPATSDVIRANGLHVDAEASPPNVEGVINAILSHES